MSARLGNQLSHRFTEKNLSAYIDDRLSDSQRRRVERHLKDCATCRSEAADLRMLVQLMRQAPVKAVPRSFTLPLTVAAEQTPSRRLQMAFGGLRAATVALSFVLVALVSSDYLLGQGFGRYGGLAPQSAPMEPERAASVARESEDQVPIAAEARIMATPQPPPGEEGMANLVPQEQAEPAAASQGSRVGIAPEAQVAGTMAAPKRMVSSPAANAPAADSVELSKEAPVGMGGGGEEPAPMKALAPDAEAAAAAQVAEAELAPTAEQLALAAAEAQAEAPTEGPVVAEIPIEERVGQPTIDQPRLESMWQVWRAVRLVTMVLGGILAVVVACLLWVWQRQRAKLR